MRRFASAAPILFGLFLLVSLTPSLGRAALRIGRAFVHAGESPLEQRRRAFSPAYADGIEAIRRTIPPDEAYLLINGDGGGGAHFWVRFDLAPRRAVWARSVKERPEDVRWVVIAREDYGAPEVLDGWAGAPPSEAISPASRDERGNLAGTALPGLGAIILFGLPGLALTRLVPALRGLPLLHRTGYGYLLGLAAIAGGLYVLSYLGVPLGQAAVFGLAAAPLLIFLLPKGPSAPIPARRSPLSLVALISLIAGALLSLGVLAEAVANPLTDWDGRMTWSTQARYVLAAESVRPPVLEEERWSITHPRYPLLLPVAQAAVMRAFGAGPDRQIFRPLYAAFLPALLLVLHDAARRLSGRKAAALAVLAACGIPMLAFGLNGGAAGAYSDLPLGCFYGAALALLLRPAPRLGDGIAAGLLLAAAVLTKNEGAPLAGAALAASALFFWRQRRRGRRFWAPLAAAGLVAVLALGFLAAWRSGIPNREDEDYAGTLASRSLWPEMVTRAPLLLSRIARRTADWQDWQGFWLVAPLLLLAGRRGVRRRIAPPLFLATAAPLAIAWTAYSVHWDPGYLIGVTWNRMLIQAVVPILLLLSLALGGLARHMLIVKRR